ncbi:major facilitator superfamily domain-containing protein [Plectosphaerella plurivora]|uniref:Major facilitator superfamily domain-containing protein n=1 Tax=Plectosphaerella plurivora TaxID=936078 RepID=A0A9P8VCU0_9PEZI|nr:major facilitator superfamily domain-containing protein [Plectosphaerella plurivora]
MGAGKADEAEAVMATAHSTPETSESDQDITSSSFPEGGKEAWLVVLGAWGAMVSCMGLLNTLAVLQAWVSEHQLRNVSESNIGWIFSTYGFFLYFCGAQIGPIFDAHDIKVLIIPSSIGMVASIMAIFSEFYHFLHSFGVLGGISASLLFYPSVSAIGHWFSRRRSLATGISFTAGGLGGNGLGCLLLKKRLPPNKAKGSSIDLKALGDLRYAVVTLAIFLVEFSVFIPYTFISSYAISKGMDPQRAYLLNTLLNVGALPGRVLPGYVADKIGVFNVMVGTAFACTASILGLWLPIRSEAAITASTILFGFWSGAAIALSPVCIGQVCHVEDYGKKTGTTFFIASFGALLGVPIAGAILQASGGDYRGLIILAGASCGATALAFIWARQLILSKPV